MGYLTWWNLPKKAWLIILGELFVIIGLSAWLVATYINDAYFQTYTNSLAPIAVPVLSVTFGICAASIATYFYLGMKKIRVVNNTEYSKKKSTQKRTGKPSFSAVVPDTHHVETAVATSATKLRPLGSVSKQQQKPQSKGPHESTSSHGAGKNRDDAKS